MGQLAVTMDWKDETGGMETSSCLYTIATSLALAQVYTAAAVAGLARGRLAGEAALGGKRRQRTRARSSRSGNHSLMLGSSAELDSIRYACTVMQLLWSKKYALSICVCFVKPLQCTGHYTAIGFQESSLYYKQ